MNGNERFIIEVTIERKELNNVLKVLENNDYKNTTLSIKELEKISGKLKKRVNLKI